MADQFFNPLSFCRGNRDHRNSKRLFHLIHQHRTAVYSQFVHHIQCDDHRESQFQKLHRQIQVSLNIRGVYNIDDPFRFLLDHKFPCHDLLAAVWRHGVNPRQVRDQCVVMSSDHSIFPVHSDSRKISDMLLRSGQLIKQRRLSAILVSNQRKGESLAIRQRIFFLAVMEFSPLPIARMMFFQTAVLLLLLCMLFRLLMLRSVRLTDLYTFRILQTDRQLIPVDPKFDRISHRRVLDHSNLCSLDQPHI